MHSTVPQASFPAKVWELVQPYWRSYQGRIALGLLSVIAVVEVGAVFALVWVTKSNKIIFDTLANRDLHGFFLGLGQFAIFSSAFVAMSVYKLYLRQLLEMKWRIWLTNTYIEMWTWKQRYYHLELMGRGTDNPDQRIAEDLQHLTSGALSLSVGLLSSLVTLASFLGILWVLSGPLAFSLFGTEIVVPAYLVWTAVIFSGLGTACAHLIGRRLIPLNVSQQKLEADFRFGLVRIRENAEGVALQRGEPTERRYLSGLVDGIQANWRNLILTTKRLTGFQVGYFQLAALFPLLVAAPRYFANKLTMGEMIQVAAAFNQVQGALSWLIDAYREFVVWKASVERLLSFHNATDIVECETRDSGIRREEHEKDSIEMRDLTLTLPGGLAIAQDINLLIAPGTRLLVTGPSGCGKSTLFRAIAGIWPFGLGTIVVPDHSKMMFLPQKPYMPTGSIRRIVSYPTETGVFAEDVIEEVLRALNLSRLLGYLDHTCHWGQVLSGGEQQRIALARVLLHRPSWLFLDEATSAQDFENETHIYQLLQARLQGASIVSIAHRPEVARYHTLQVEFVRKGDHLTVETRSGVTR